MANFKITGNVEPFLKVELKDGEKLYCDSNSMISMHSNLDLDGKMKGGFFGAFKRKLLNNESVSDDDMEIFNNACAAIVEPNMRDTAFEAYCEFMENDMDNWVSWISQTFGEDWGTLADIIRQYGY